MLESWLKNQTCLRLHLCLSSIGFLRWGALFIETHSNPKGSVPQIHSFLVFLSDIPWLPPWESYLPAWETQTIHSLSPWGVGYSSNRVQQSLGLGFGELLEEHLWSNPGRLTVNLKFPIPTGYSLDIVFPFPKFLLKLLSDIHGWVSALSTSVLLVNLGHFWKEISLLVRNIES